MAQIAARLNTQMGNFPLLSRLSTRTILVPQVDQTYVPGVNPQNSPTIDRGIPSVVYGHNIMPSSYGIQSIAYTPRVRGITLPSVGDRFNYTAQIYGALTSGPDPVANNEKGYIAIIGPGSNKIYTMGFYSNTWTAIAGAPVTTATTRLTVATVNGFSYIYFSGIGCYVFSPATNTLVPRTLTGLNPVNIQGIVTTQGYMLAWTETGISWSSSVNVEDFTPDPITGAGGGQVQEAEGRIILCVPTVLGLIVFCEGNGVSCLYSGNDQFPFNFKAIPSCGGLHDRFMVSKELSGGIIQAYTTNGLQQVSHQTARSVFPEITDFLTGKLLEDFNSATNTLTELVASAGMRKRINSVSERYIIISYGVSQSGDFTHAILIDTAQSRIGKLRIVHTDCFELQTETTSANPDVARESIGFLERNGIVSTVNFTFNALANDSVLIMGKVQYVRTRRLELQEVVVENGDTPQKFQLLDLPSLNGKTFGPAIAGYRAEQTRDYSKWLFSQDGENHSFLMKGTFNVICIVPKFVVTSGD